MSLPDAKSEFFAEVAAWGQMLEAKRSGTSDTGIDTTPTSEENDWLMAAKILKGGRLVYGYTYLFIAIGVLLTALAIIGAILMVARLKV